MSLVDSWQGSTILANAEDELVGKTLNNTYAVERVLGEGAMGRVYQARHTRIAQKLVAVKVLRPEYLRNADVLARFQREAETAASISHPNVVAVYDVDRTSRGLSYLVSEYLEGIDLGLYLKQQKKVSLSTAVHIARQLCEGLGAAHRCGVIHRDLKPSNIFLVGDFASGVPEFPFVKILDFGLSKFMDAPVGQLVTETGIIMGTPAFMPPEQAQGQQADLRADIYGVGALLYICLTGRLPYDEATPQATVLAVIGTEPPRPRAIAPSIPDYAELVIQRAMARQPEARYPDMGALLEALEPLLEEPQVRYAGSSSRLEPRSSLDIRIEGAKTARLELVLFLGSALILLFGSAAVSVAGIEQAARWSLTRRELGLLLACGVAVAITPTLLVVRRIRRLVWENTSRVLELLSRVRSAVLTTVSIYGLAWLGSRVFDGVVLRLLGEPSQVNLAWPGWDFLLPLMAVGAGLVALLRERALSARLSGAMRALVVIVATLATLALVALAIPVGLRWQARTASINAGAAPGARPSVSSREMALAESVASGTISALPRVESQPESVASAAPGESASTIASALPAQLASEEELRAASGRGETGCLPLAERYPTDSRVLRALVLAHASHSDGLSDAMLVTRRLIKVAPDEATSGDLQYLIQRAAETPGAPAELAWRILAEEMGTNGPDLLYRLILTKPKLAERAELLLGNPAVRQHITPALAIARELRAAPSCAARLPLLERAIIVGDERALAVLGALSTGSAHGCGKNKRKPCSPACPEQVEQLRAAIGKISQRLRGSGK